MREPAETLAEGRLPTGERWLLKLRGNASDLHSILETVHPDGRRDAGGMGGPPLDRARLMNVYTGGSTGGLRRVVIRADLRVARIRLATAAGEHLDLPLLATRPGFGVGFFATLLPSAAALLSATALGPDGRELEEFDLSLHEWMWRRHNGPGAPGA